MMGFDKNLSMYDEPNTMLHASFFTNGLTAEDMLAYQFRSNKTFDFSQMQTASVNESSVPNQITEPVISSIAEPDPCRIPDDMRTEIARQQRIRDSYKTALCDSYRRTNTCPYGNNCRFAHGLEELRLPSNPRGKNHPKYKTVLCDKFSTTGECPYGPRCQFIHKIVNPTILNTAQSVVQQALSRTTSRQGENSSPVDLNMSMPLSRQDINRAFARASGVDSSVDRLLKTCEHSFPKRNDIWI